MLTTFLAPFLPYIIAAVAGLAALWGYGAKRAADGRKQAEDRANEQDATYTDGIRDGMRDLPDRVRKFDSAGFRSDE